MQQTISTVCQAFTRNPDGSWTSITPADIQTEVGAIRIPPGMTFIKDRPVWSIDVTVFLDENCNW